MSNKFNNQYRIPSNRMAGWDYNRNGFYYLTIVTAFRKCNLGKIKNGNMILSDFGKIVKQEWLKSFRIRNELFCDEYIIMPNHIHAIVILFNNANDNKRDDSGNASGDEFGNVETHGRASQHPKHQHPKHQHPRQNNTQDEQKPKLYRLPKSISSFVAGFKSGVNTEIDNYIDNSLLNILKYNRHNLFFQRNYHDRIIRDKKEYLRIKEYIRKNPSQWKYDRFNLLI